MPKTEIRTAVVAGVAVLLLFGATLLMIRHERTVHLERVQGAWEGTLHFHWGRLMCVRRMVLRISSENGTYHALVDEVDLAHKNEPVTDLVVGRTAVAFKLSSGGSYRGDLDSGTMEIRGRWTWPGGKYSQPLAFSFTYTPDPVQDPLAEGECMPRPGSDLQGLWQGTLKVDKPLRLHLKIAEGTNGAFRAETDSLDQPPVVPTPITFLTYDQPRVKFSLQGIAAAYEGELNEDHSKITGTWTQGKPTPLTFERINPAEEKQEIRMETK